MKFCFLCGKKTNNLINGYCESCYNKNFKLLEVPNSLIILQCKKCGKIKQKNVWKDIEIEDVIKDSIKILGKNVKIKINGNKIFANGYLTNSKELKKDVYEINLKIIKKICSNCLKKLSGYYEAIIQLRGNLSKNVLNLIDKQINEKSFYRTEVIKEGLNLYIGNKNMANKIAEILKKRYGFKIKKSFKLFTKKEGKDIYRNIILIKCD